MRCGMGCPERDLHMSSISLCSRTPYAMKWITSQIPNHKRLCHPPPSGSNASHAWLCVAGSKASLHAVLHDGIRVQSECDWIRKQNRDQVYRLRSSLGMQPSPPPAPHPHANTHTHAHFPISFVATSAPQPVCYHPLVPNTPPPPPSLPTFAFIERTSLSYPIHQSYRSRCWQCMSLEDLYPQWFTWH
jgi:hypothetical protein